ncbi:MAG: TonB-dependent receptor, partial [Bacteroidetes bacterium]|nr:TonB-dependent receptor [Bacteroidota bacterium]
LALLQKIGIKIVGDAIPRFQDLSFNMNFPTEKAGRFTLFGIGGLSAINEKYEGETVNYKDRFNTSLGVAGLTHSYIINPKTWVKTTFAATHNGNNYSGDFLDTNDVYMYNELKEEFGNSALRVSVNLHHKIDRKNSIKTGIILSRLSYGLYSRSYDDELSTYFTSIDRKGSTGSAQSFVNWQHRFNDRLSLNTGLHYMRFALNGNQSFEPRAGIKWNFKGNQILSAGVGVHSRLEDLSIYFSQRTKADGSTELPNRDLGLSKSLHYVLGYETMLSQYWHLKTEVYYQHLFDVPVNSEASDHLSMINLNDGYTSIKAENSGTGYNRGVEITLEKYFSSKWYMMLTSSVYDSKYRGSDGVLRNTAYNGNYAGSILAGKEFNLGSNRVLSVNLRSLLAGGKRYTPVNLQESIAAGEGVYDYSRAYESRGSFYRRLDVGISYTINKPKTTRVWKIDIQNATNRLNEYSRYYDFDTQKIETSTQAGIIPTLSYRIEF